jgi:adenylate cyclase
MALLEKLDSQIRLQIEPQDRVLEVGRQTKHDPPPLAVVIQADVTRLVIATREQTEIGRHQLRIEVTGPQKVRLTNINDVNSVTLSSGAVVGPGEAADSPLPIRVIRGSVQLRIEVVGGDLLDEPEEESSGEFQSLMAAPPSPSSVIPITAPKSDPKLSRESTSESLVASIRNSHPNEMFERLGQLVIVLQRAASTTDFADVIARTALEMVNLDHAAVLKHDGSRWSVVAVSERHDDRESEWFPSQTLLRQVMRDRRTMWGTPGAAGPEVSVSAAPPVAVVAAPILSDSGQIVGAVYGDRQIGLALNRPALDKFDAKMVEIMACGVAGGWARMEQERNAAARRVQLERFVTKEIAQRLEEDPDALLGRDAEVTMLFCDIAGFSRISEQLSPTDTFQWINAVMEMLSVCVLETKGTLVDYIGDELIAMWGAPLAVADHANAAAEAAVKMLESLKTLNEKFALPAGESTQIGIGLNSGKVRVGNTGTEHKLKYGPLGSDVNIASRVQGATRYLRTPALITGATAGQLDGKFRTRRLCSVRLKNIEHPVELFELVANPGPDWSRFAADYERALTAWEQHQLQPAIESLSQLVGSSFSDGPTMVLLSRAVEAWSQDQHDYDPVWTLPTK